VEKIRNIPAKIQESKKITPLRRHQPHGNGKQFAQEIDQHLRRKNKTFPPGPIKEKHKNKKPIQKTSEEGKGQFVDIEV